MRKFILQLSITLALLVFMVSRVDWAQVAGTMAGVAPLFFLASTLTAIAGTLPMAYKYRMLLRGSPLELPLSRLLAINFISRFYALFLPSALGPEAVRWLKVTGNKRGRSFFLAATVVERLFFLLTLLACGAVPLLLTADPALQLLARRIFPLLAGAFILLTLALIFFLVPAVNDPLRRRLLGLLRSAPGSKLHGFVVNFALRGSSLRVVAVLLVQTLAWQALFLARMYLLFLALGLPFSFWDSTWMGSLVLLLQTLPVTYAGLGLREGAYAYLFQLQGVAPEMGVAVGLLFFVQLLIFAVLGWFFETRDLLADHR